MMSDELSNTGRCKCKHFLYVVNRLSSTFNHKRPILDGIFPSAFRYTPHRRAKVGRGTEVERSERLADTSFFFFFFFFLVFSKSKKQNISL